MEPVVTENPEQERYEIHVDGELAGFAEYRGSEPRAFTHTEIAEQFGGQGLATKLIRFALDDMRARGVLIVPLCPFVAKFLQDHHDYLDLVAPHIRRAYNLPDPE